MGVNYFLSHTINTETYPLQPMQYENYFFVLSHELGQSFIFGNCSSEQSSVSNYNNRISKTVWKGIGNYNFYEPCYSYNFSPIEYMCYTNQENYVSGLGKVLSQNVNPYATRICIWHMSYYRKGNETWGTPVNLSQLVNYDEFEKQQIKISPNPFAEILVVENLPESTKKILLQDSSGRILFQSVNIHKTRLDIKSADISSGFYFLTIETETGLSHFKLIRH